MYITRNAYLAGLIDRGLSFKIYKRKMGPTKKLTPEPRFRVSIIEGKDLLNNFQKFGGKVYTYNYCINGKMQNIAYYHTTNKKVIKNICKNVRPFLRNLKRIALINKRLKQL